MTLGNGLTLRAAERRLQSWPFSFSQREARNICWWQKSSGVAIDDLLGLPRVQLERYASRDVQPSVTLTHLYAVLRKRSFEEVYRPANSVAKVFYASREWLQLRFKILAANGVCACCGATRESGAALHVDHIYPRSFYPEFALMPENLQVLCRDCNFGKSNTWTIRF